MSYPENATQQFILTDELSENPQIISFDAGQSEITLGLSAVNDSLVEDDQVLSLGFSAASLTTTADEAYKIAAAGGTLDFTIISDDLGVVPTITGPSATNTSPVEGLLHSANQ